MNCCLARPHTAGTTSRHARKRTEIPEGRPSKFEYDKEYGILRLDQVLHTSTHHPAIYGFIPRTYADDEDIDEKILAVSCDDPVRKRPHSIILYHYLSLFLKNS